MTTTIRISRGRKELIFKYATAAVFLYGVISVDEFVEVFNYYEDAHTISEEALLSLKRLAKTDDVEYSISGDIISGPEFQPDFDDYEENVTATRAAQKGKPRYLPSKEEFLRYIEGIYREPEKPYADLRAHILKHKLTTCGEGLEGVDGDLIDLHEMIRFGVKFTDTIDFFREIGYKFKGLEDVKELTQLVMIVYNNTRMYDNNGFTPNELYEKFNRTRLGSHPQETPSNLVVHKVGRNDTCPCGSGLKYKKCHGK